MPTPPTEPPSSGGIHVGNVGGSLSIRADGDIVAGAKIIQISVDAVTQQPLDTTSPYRGLKRFEDRDKDLFFGRDQLIEKLLDRLGSSNVLLVLGASGSGKSSVVLAGVLPKLSQLAARFRYFTLVPDANPFESLRSALQGGRFSQAQTRELLDAQPDAPIRLIRGLQQEGDQWLIFVDQFEEIFTVSDERLRANFISALVKIAQHSTGSIKLVLAMRADFFDRFSPFPQFAKLIEKNIAFVTDMQVDELRLAIEQPAAKHGVVFEQGLVEEIVKDVQGQAGSLPLLQYTLSLCWQEEERSDGLADRHLNTQTYRQLGGVRGALQKRADEIYASFGDDADPKGESEKQKVVRQIFLRVVDLAGQGSDEGAWRPVRRRVPKAIFSSAQEQEILQALIDQKLLVSSGRQGAQATVEVAHEALFTSWERLKGWIEGGKEVIFVRNRFADDARVWHSHRLEDGAGADEDLLSGSRLDQALDMRKRGEFDTILGGLPETETQFLDASAALRDRRRQEEAKAAAQQRRLTGAMVLGFLIALVAAGISIYVEHKRAEEAARQNRINIAQRLAAQADNVLAEDPQLTLALAAEALQVALRAGEPIVPAAEQSLRNAFAQIGLSVLSGQKKGVESAVLYAFDGSGPASDADDNAIQLSNIIEKSPAPAFIDLIPGPMLECGAAFSPDGCWLATMRRDGPTGSEVRLWALKPEDRTRTLGCHAARDLAFSHDSLRLVAAGGATGAAWLCDLGASDPLPLYQGGDSVAVACSHNGHWLASGGWNGSVRLWDLTVRNIAAVSNALSAPKHGDVRSVAFSLDSRWLAAACGGVGRIWDVATPKRTNVFFDLPYPKTVLAVAFGPNSRLAVGGGSGSVWLWDLTHALPTASSLPLPGHKGDVWAVAFSPDGRRLATAGADKTVRLWDLSVSDPATSLVALAGHQTPILRIAFSPDGRWLATSSEDGAVRLWLIKLQELMDLAAVAGRNLSHSEWQRYFPGQDYRRIFPTLDVPPDPPEDPSRGPESMP